MIEQGHDWIHLIVSASGIETGISIVAPLKALVDGGHLGLYATTTEQIAMLRSYRISTLADAVTYPDVEGYNSGNLIEGFEIFQRYAKF